MSGRHYLDHASTSPLRREAVAAVMKWCEEHDSGDPGRPHMEGRTARDEIEQARAHLAGLFRVREREVIFTSSGTEAIATANGTARAASGPEAPIAYADIEHAAVRLGAQRLGPTIVLPVDRAGRIDPERVKDALSFTPRPALVHCQFANHEVATLQPVDEIVALCRAAGVLVHVDACAAAGQLPIDLGTLGADFVSISGHKLGAPTGIGALIVRRGVRVRPLFVGGDQERARRAGFENLIGIVGFGAVAKALNEPGVLAEQATAAWRATTTISAAVLQVDGVVPYGDTQRRIPHIVCFGIGDVEAEGVVLGLDQRGIAVHSGSACSSETFEPSPVLQAMGLNADRSLRCSVGWSTEDDDVQSFANAFPEVVRSLRELRSA